MPGTKEGADKRWAKARLDGTAENVREQLRKNGHLSTPGGFGTDKVGADGLTGVERSRLASMESKVRKANDATT